jgi:hypothetical protein
MTEPQQPAQPAAPPQASPPAAPAPAAPAPAPEAGLTAAEEATLAELTARRDAALVAAGAAVMLKVEAPHESLTHGGVTVTTEFTSVPAGMAAAVLTAAGEAGVKITQQET